MAANAPQRMTVEEFLALPEPETGHYELVEGELVVSFPTRTHQNVVRNILLVITTWRRAGADRGTESLEIDTSAGATSMLGPDVQWWAHGRDLPDPAARPHPLGDIVVEVRSPSTWAIDVGRKKRLYEQEGVQELWLVDPLSRTVLVFARSSPGASEFDLARDLGPEDKLESPLLPAFSVGVAALFED